MLPAALIVLQLLHLGFGAYISQPLPCPLPKEPHRMLSRGQGSFVLIFCPGGHHQLATCNPLTRKWSKPCPNNTVIPDEGIIMLPKRPQIYSNQNNRNFDIFSFTQCPVPVRDMRRQVICLSLRCNAWIENTTIWQQCVGHPESTLQSRCLPLPVYDLKRRMKRLVWTPPLLDCTDTSTQTTSAGGLSEPTYLSSSLSGSWKLKVLLLLSLVTLSVPCLVLATLLLIRCLRRSSANGATTFPSRAVRSSSNPGAPHPPPAGRRTRSGLDALLERANCNSLWRRRPADESGVGRSGDALRVPGLPTYEEVMQQQQQDAWKRHQRAADSMTPPPVFVGNEAINQQATTALLTSVPPETEDVQAPPPPYSVTPQFPIVSTNPAPPSLSIATNCDQSEPVIL